MKKIMIFIGAMVALTVSRDAWAVLDIRITEGVSDGLPIAIVPFKWEGNSRVPPQHFANIISSDLRRSGKFRPLTLSELPEITDRSLAGVMKLDWRSTGANLVMFGEITEKDDGSFDLSYQLVNTLFKAKDKKGAGLEKHVLLKKVFKLDLEHLRFLAHSISNDIYEEIIGVRGAFNTKVAYIVINHKAEEPYQLYTADVDGFNSKLLIKQVQPLMSPSWSPDSKHLAYVSFENGRSEIVVHTLRTNQRRVIASYRGINGSPVWSPQGDKMALVLSNGYNPDIYILDLSTKKLKRITKNRAIETEPSWSPDGKSLIFTSDRGGRPQIYRIGLEGQERRSPTRLTFEGDYNAGASFFPDGKRLVLVHRFRGVYHIATLDLETDNLQVLTKTHLDESPSLAPNGSMILYATVSGQRQVLAAVSVDGRFNFTLPARQGEVRAPAWSPYLD